MKSRNMKMHVYIWVWGTSSTVLGVAEVIFASHYIILKNFVSRMRFTFKFFSSTSKIEVKTVPYFICHEDP